MKILLKNIFIISFLIIVSSSFAADSAFVKFNFNPLLVLEKFAISVNDGINEYNFKPKDSFYWKGELFSPFGYVEIRCNKTDTSYDSKKIFFTKGKLSIFLVPSQNEKESFSVDKKSSNNLVPYGKMGGDLLDSFIKQEDDKLINFYHENRNQFETNPELVHEMFLLSDTVNYKRIEFIKQHPDTFLAFWLFASHIARTDIVKPDTLMKLYDNALTDRYKNSKAAVYLVSLIKNKVAITSNSTFPDFTVSDINGKRIESVQLRDKYLLIQFWASWCHPCLDELPVLKELNKKYAQQDFQLISFSIDKDSIAFQRAINKYSMNWTQIFRGSNSFSNSLGISGVPQLYLIDKSGKVVYNKEMAEDWDLVLLKKVLSERIKIK